MDILNELTGKMRGFAASQDAKMLVFISQANENILFINELINQYNQTNNTFKKQGILNRIEQEQQVILKKYPPDLIAASADFAEQIHNKLFNNIKQARTELGIPSRHEDNSLAKLIETMSPHKLAQLMDILDKGSLFNATELHYLYSSGTHSPDEARNFETFLNTVSIRFIGGKESNEFKVTYPSGDCLKLSLKNQHNQPALINETLNKPSLSHVISPIQIERMGSFTHSEMYQIKPYPLPEKAFLTQETLYINASNSMHIEYTYLDKTNEIKHGFIDHSHPLFQTLHGINNQNLTSYLTSIFRLFDLNPINRTVSRTLVVSEFTQGKDLQYSSTQITSIDEKIKSAAHIYSQMGDTLERLVENKLFFSHLENTSWVLDKKNQLKISDSTFLLNTNSNGYFEANLNQWHTFKPTFLTPPELCETETLLENNLYSADKLHVYMLGKCLYQYLTDCDASALAASSLQYNYPIFKTEEGQQLKTLIKSMLINDPVMRISMAGVIEKLNLEILAPIQNKEQLFNTLQDESKQILTKITKLRLGKEDAIMDAFETNIRLKLKTTPLGELIELHASLKSILDTNQHGSLIKIKDYLNAIHGSYFKKTAYKEIENALLAIPIEQRGFIPNKDEKNSIYLSNARNVLQKHCKPKWIEEFYQSSSQQFMQLKQKHSENIHHKKVDLNSLKPNKA